MLKNALKVCLVVALTLACLTGVVVQFQPTLASGFCCDDCGDEYQACKAQCPPRDFPCLSQCARQFVDCNSICC